MAFVGFIKIGDIKGESTDAKHTGWIEILDCGMDILQTNATTVSSAGGQAMGKAATGWDRERNCAV